MSRKNRKDKQLSALRRELEILRRQAEVKKDLSELHPSPAVISPKEAFMEKAPAATTVGPAFDAQCLMADLRKTALMTLVCLGVTALLAKTQPQWPEYALSLSYQLVKLPFYH